MGALMFKATVFLILIIPQFALANLHGENRKSFYLNSCKNAYFLVVSTFVKGSYDIQTLKTADKRCADSAKESATIVPWDLQSDDLASCREGVFKAMKDHPNLGKSTVSADWKKAYAVGCPN
jgi:hypothetical protein